VSQQFAEVPILPDFKHGMADYNCDAFPMEEKPVDSFIVGLISLAVSLPVVLFLQSCFGIANDSEAPESWLEWYGWRKLVFGLNAHRRWHYTGPAGQPNRHVRWFVRSVGAPPSETAINLYHSAVALATCSDPPWFVEAREAASDGDDGVSDTAAADEARELARYKHTLMAAGLAGVYITWAIFTWCVPCPLLLFVCLLKTIPAHRFVFTYGMLIYNLLGQQAEHDFAKSWGVSYAMGAAAEWKVCAREYKTPCLSSLLCPVLQDILTEALRGAVLVIVLESLFLTRPLSWLEEHLDYLFLQSTTFGNVALGFRAQIGVFWRNTRRLA